MLRIMCITKTVDRLVVMISKMGSLIRVRPQFRIIKKVRVSDIPNKKFKGGLRNGRNDVHGNIWNYPNNNQQMDRQITLELV